MNPGITQLFSLQLWLFQLRLSGNSYRHSLFEVRFAVQALTGVKRVVSCS